MTLELVPLTGDADVERMVDALEPGFNGDRSAARELLVQTVSHLARNPRPDPWGSYLGRQDGAFVAAGAFKLGPGADGSVEIAYTTFPAFQGSGHATRLVAALCGLAFAAATPRVVAHTLAEENASNRALRRNGFAFVGEIVDPEDGPVWRWEKHG